MLGQGSDRGTTGTFRWWRAEFMNWRGLPDETVLEYDLVSEYYQVRTEITIGCVPLRGSLAPLCQLQEPYLYRLSEVRSKGCTILKLWRKRWPGTGGMRTPFFPGSSATHLPHPISFPPRTVGVSAAFGPWGKHPLGHRTSDLSATCDEKTIMDKYYWLSVNT